MTIQGLLSIICGCAAALCIFFAIFIWAYQKMAESNAVAEKHLVAAVMAAIGFGVGGVYASTLDLGYVGDMSIQAMLSGICGMAAGLCIFVAIFTWSFNKISSEGSAVAEKAMMGAIMAAIGFSVASVYILAQDFPI